jgi:CHAT domain-containing protein
LNNLAVLETDQEKFPQAEPFAQRALEVAEAQPVMMSLWPVPDQETLELMKLFYPKWRSGTDKHEALKQAQLEMRQRVRAEHHGHDLPCT